MLFYWNVFLLLMLLSFIEQFTNLSKRTCEKICIVISLLLIFFSTIRWNQIKGDWQGYYGVFKNSNIKSFSDIFNVRYWTFEPIYYLIMRTVRYFTGSYIIFQFIVSACVNLLFYKSAKYFNDTVYNENVYIDKLQKSRMITSYFIWWATSCCDIFTVRTNIAAAMLIFSIRYVEKRDFKRFILCVLFAEGVHFTSIIFIPVYFLYKNKLRLRTWTAITLCAAFVNIIGLPRVISVFGILGGRFEEKVNRYNMDIGYADFSYTNYSTVFLVIRAMANITLVLLIALVIKYYLKNNNRISGLINVYLVGFIIQMLTLGYNFELSRVSIYFICQQYFILPYTFEAFRKNRVMNIFSFALFSVYMAVKMYSLIGSADDYMNLSNVLFKS